jgi:hypothetical protein
MRFGEKVIEHRLRKLTTISKNQFSCMLARSTIEAIFLIRQFIERYMEQKRICIWYLLIWKKRMTKYQEISCDGCLKRKGFNKVLVFIKDMYTNIMTSVRAYDDESNIFSIKIGLHEESVLSPYIFTLVMDEVTMNIQGDIS